MKTKLLRLRRGRGQQMAHVIQETEKRYLIKRVYQSERAKLDYEDVQTWISKNDPRILMVLENESI